MTMPDAVLAPAFDFGGTLRRLRRGERAVPGGTLTIEALAGMAGMEPDRLRIMETRANLFNRWLGEADTLATAMGMKLTDIIEAARVRR